MEIYKALRQFQSRIGAIPKDSQGHGYRYASLDKIWDAIRKPLSDCGLSVFQGVEMVEGLTAVRTIIAHDDGSTLESVAVAPAGETNKRMSAVQQMGSEVTYLRRYGLSAALGLTTDEDTDGAWMHADEARSVYMRAVAFESVEEFSALKAELQGKHNGKIPAEVAEMLRKAHAEFTARKEN